MMEPRSALLEFETRYNTICTDSADEFVERYETFHGGYSAKICENGSTGSTAAIASQAVDQMRVVFARWNFGFEGTLRRDTEHYCVRVPVAGVSKTIDRQSGLTARSGEIAVFSAREGVKTIAEPCNAALNLAIPRHLLRSSAMSFYQNELNANLDFHDHVAIRSPQGAMLKSLFDHILAHVVSSKDGQQNPSAARVLEEHVARLLLSTVPNNYSKSARSESHGIAPRIVKEAEAFMQHFADQPLTLAMICDHAGCSLRALQNAFKQFRGQTPMSKLRDIRLEGAHHDLKHDAATVTQTAFKWGFSNPGRFAILYREKFGEKPSETNRLMVYEGRSVAPENRPRTHGPAHAP